MNSAISGFGNETGFMFLRRVVKLRAVERFGGRKQKALPKQGFSTISMVPVFV
jgi:hypothetical protein